MKLLVVGALVLGAVGVFVWVGVVEGSIPRHGINDFFAKHEGKECWVDGGKIRSIERNAAPLIFTLESPTNPDLVLRVESPRNPPDNFKIGGNVGCKGVYQDGKFHAVELVTSCPSKYEESKEVGTGTRLPAGVAPAGPGPAPAGKPDPGRTAEKGP